MKKGTLTPDYYIKCGICEYGLHIGETVKRIAAQAAWSLGWRQTKEHGWVCPDCAKTGSAS